MDFNQGFKFLGHMFIRSLILKSKAEKDSPDDIEQLMKDLAVKDSSALADKKAQDIEEEELERHGLSPGLRNLHIMERNRRLHIRNQAFTVQEEFFKDTPDKAKDTADKKRAWKELIAIPHQQIDRIDIGPKAQISDAAISHALATDTVVAYVDGHGKTVGWIASELAPRAGRHMAQAKIIADDEKRLALAASIVEARLRNQRAVLRRLCGRYDKNDRPQDVLDCILTLNKTLGRGDVSYIRQSENVAQLMGYEGLAAAGWWKAISALSHEKFRFSGRRKMGMPAKANICLNFLSWMLNRDIAVAVRRAGLHPGFGILHSVSDRREACVYDLMEEFRAHLIGGLFVYCTNRNIIKADMFSYSRKTGGLRLKSEGATALIRAYETRANGKVKSPYTGIRGQARRVTWRQLMVEQAFAFAAHIEGSHSYQPYIMDY
jgi:CRISPR-associated protein Cas1